MQYWAMLTSEVNLVTKWRSVWNVWGVYNPAFLTLNKSCNNSLGNPQSACCIVKWQLWVSSFSTRSRHFSPGRHTLRTYQLDLKKNYSTKSQCVRKKNFFFVEKNYFLKQRACFSLICYQSWNLGTSQNLSDKDI